MKRERNYSEPSVGFSGVYRQHWVFSWGPPKHFDKGSRYNPKRYDPLRKERKEEILWDGNGRGVDHECLHVVEETLPQQPSYERRPSALDNPGSAPAFDVDSYEMLNYVSFGNAVMQAVPAPTTPPVRLDWGHAWEALRNDMAGLMPADVSIAVNIAEFASLRRLVPSLAKQIRSIMKMTRGKKYHSKLRMNKLSTKWDYLVRDDKGIPYSWSYSRISYESRSWSWCLRDLAGAHLGFSFGVQPLVEDLTNWCTKFFQLQQHLNWYRTVSNGEWHVFRAMTPVVKSHSETHSQRQDEFRIPWSLTTTEEHESFGILRVRARLHPKSGGKLASAVAAQLLGINVPLSIAWELVPFSFVADWFLPLGEFISRVEPRRLFGTLAETVEIQSIWHSEKHVDRNYTTCTPAVKAVGSENIVSLQDGHYERSKTTYARRSGDPGYTVLPALKTRYGITQFALSASLLAQRLIKK